MKTSTLIFLYSLGGDVMSVFGVPPLHIIFRMPRYDQNVSGKYDLESIGPIMNG